jgi:hypothetical protein
MRRVLLALVAGACLALALADSAAAAPLDGVVTGQVTNGTAGAAVPVGDAVTLVVFSRQAQNIVDQKSAVVDDAGRYTFSGLDRDPNLVYFAFVRHGGVSYPIAQPLQLQDQPSQQADIRVFETTNVDDAIRFERLNLIVVGVQPGLLQVMQMGAVNNTGDRTFVTENPQDQALARGLQFALPKGALGAHFQAGFTDRDVAPAFGGLQVTSPVTPGQHEFALAYQVPYSGSDADLSLQLPYAVGSFTLYLPQNGPRLGGGPPLAQQPPAQLGGQTYQVYAAQNLGRSTSLGAQLAGLPSNGGLSSTQVALVGLGVAAFVLGGGLLLFGARRGQPRRPSAAELEEERLQLVVRLAALDERFAAGAIGAGDYAAERERGKQRLVELTSLARGSSA